MPSAGVYPPITAGERFVGMFGIESFEREDAFDAAAVRLLQTVVASLGHRVENACAPVRRDAAPADRDSSAAAPSWR